MPLSHVIKNTVILRSKSGVTAIDKLITAELLENLCCFKDLISHFGFQERVKAKGIPSLSVKRPI